MDGDVPAVPAADREGDGARGARSPRSARRCGPPTAATARRCGRSRRRAPSPRWPATTRRGRKALKEPGWKNIFVDGKGNADSLRQPVARDAGAADVQRGRGQARPAADVDGARARRESRAHLRAVPAQGRDPRRRRRRPHASGTPTPDGTIQRRATTTASPAGRSTRAGRRRGRPWMTAAARAGAAEPGPARAEAGLRAATSRARVPVAPIAGGAG